MHKKKVSGAPVRYVAVCWSPWLYVHSCTHTWQSIHGSRGKFQIARAAGLLMCCLCYWEEITRGNFKYRPVNLQSFKKEQRKMQARNIR